MRGQNRFNIVGNGGGVELGNRIRGYSKGRSVVDYIVETEVVGYRG